MRYLRWRNPNLCPGHETCIWFCARTQTCDFCYITHKRRGCAPDENCTRYLPLPLGNFPHRQTRRNLPYRERNETYAELARPQS